MTLEEFRKLGWLITRKQFMQATGLDGRDVAALVAAGTIRVWHRPAVKRGAGRCGKKAGQRGAYGRYYKIDAAEICGFEISKL